MALPKTDKKIKDMVQADEMWKVYIRAGDDSEKIWRYNWGWMLDEYKDLKQKMDEKTATSELLKRVTKEKKRDNRVLGNFPLSLNHWYGWLAEKKEYHLESMTSPDFFKPLPLPEIYRVTEK
ncbi:uncharacterized protein [Leptinotarsa decemlineata]|uniref:uncharacterized protein n=1 Tax=Leptinotarsa decemlineata TaxID=7539 RepID=UPI000C2559D0|nr:uncharacterized protein LOC111505115 [Leptinotarsa decemlineata]